MKIVFYTSILTKMLWIETSETSLDTVFMRHIKIIKWPYSNVPSVQLICSIEYGFLILTWIRTVIFHSRRLVTKNTLNQFLCICMKMCCTQHSAVYHMDI